MEARWLARGHTLPCGTSLVISLVPFGATLFECYLPSIARVAFRNSSREFVIRCGCRGSKHLTIFSTNSGEAGALAQTVRYHAPDRPCLELQEPALALTRTSCFAGEYGRWRRSPGQSQRSAFLPLIFDQIAISATARSQAEIARTVRDNFLDPWGLFSIENLALTYEYS